MSNPVAVVLVHVAQRAIDRRMGLVTRRHAGDVGWYLMTGWAQSKAKMKRVLAVKEWRLHL